MQCDHRVESYCTVFSFGVVCFAVIQFGSDCLVFSAYVVVEGVR